MKKSTFLIGIFVVLGLLVSCAPDEVPPPEPEVIVESPEVDNALITFITGDVFIQKGEEEIYANIGDYLEKDDILRTEDGYAELQFGDIGTARVQENTTVRIANIILQAGATEVDINLVSGQVLNKVEHLAMDDRYEVRTDTAVMGVLPSAVDENRLKESAGTSRTAARAVEAAVAAIQEISPVIEANQELTVNRETVAETEEVARQIVEQIEEIAKIEEPEVEEDAEPAQESPEVAAQISQLVEVARASARQAAKVAVAPPQDISEETREKLEEIDEIRVIAIPQRPAVSETDEGEEPVEEAAPPTLLPIVIEVEPADATISRDGRIVGRGRFQGIFLQGEMIDVRIEKEGFVSKDLHVEITEARGRSISVKLPEIPQPEAQLNRVDISVEPSEARIVVDGEDLGSRRVRAELQVGSTIQIRAELEGFHTAEQTYTVQEGRNANSLSFNLERIMVPLSVTATPPEAMISVDGRETAMGRYRAEVPWGTVLQVEVSLYGYEDASLNLTAEEGIEPITLQLERKSSELEISVEPANAGIFLNGERVADGIFSGDYPVGTELALLVRLSGYRDFTREVRVEEENDPFNVSLERIMGTLSVRVQPTDSDIYVDGRKVASGSFSREYPWGTELEVELRKSGYAPLTFPVTIQEGANSLNYQLTQDVGTITISVSPQNAEVVIDGVVVGTGSITRNYPAGQDLSIEVRSENYESRSEQITIDKGSNRLNVTLQRRQATLSIHVTPEDAELFLNGSSVGRGTVRRQIPQGESVSVTARRPGYAEISQNINVNGESIERTFRLEPRPIELDVAVSDVSLVRRIAVQGDRMFSVDTQGTLRADSLSGRFLWEVATANGGYENSMPVLAGSEAHLFGRRVVPAGDDVLVPTDDGVTVLDRSGNPTGRTISVPGGSKMTPLVVDSKVVIADQQGGVHIFNLNDGSETASISTNLSQPIAHAPGVSGNVAILAGRRGEIAAIDYRNGIVLWEALMENGSGIFTDPVVSSGGVYLFSRG